jgi:hypothetical protein
MGRRLVLVALSAAVITGAWLHRSGIEHSTGAAPPPSSTTTAVGSLLGQVHVVDFIEPVPGYERSCKRGAGCVFGPPWNDPTDTTGCDTRNRILSKQLQNIRYKPGKSECKVLSGALVDPYTGATVTLANIQIDHVVSAAPMENTAIWAAQDVDDMPLSCGRVLVESSSFCEGTADLDMS